MVKVLPSFHSSASPQSHRPVSVNGSETRNTQGNFNVGFTPTMTATSQTSDVPRIRPPPPSPRANLQQRKGRSETTNRTALHESMFDLRDVGQDSFQRPQQPQPMVQTLMMTSAPKPGYPCYDRHSLNLSYQNLREVGSVPVLPQVQQQPMLPLFQNTQHNPQNRFSINTGVINNRAFPTAISSKMPENQYVNPQLPPITPTMQYSESFSVPLAKTQNDDVNMKSLHDDMAQLRLELASMKDFMREEEEFQTKQVRELEQLQKQWHESSKLIQEQKIEKEPASESTPKFNSLPITPNASPDTTQLPPKSPKPTLMVKPTAQSKASQHPDFASMKNPIQELEERFKIQTKKEETMNKQSQQAIEPKKLPPSKLSSIAPVFPTTTYTPPKSPKPATSLKPLTSPSNQLRRSYSVTPTNPTQQIKPHRPISQITFPKTGPLVPPTKPESPDQINGDKNNNYFTVPSNNSAGESKGKPIALSNVKVKRISQMFEENLNETNEKGYRQKTSPHHNDAKFGGGTIRKLSPALLQSIQASEESKLSGSQLTSRNIPKSASLKSNSEVYKIETPKPNIPKESPDFHKVAPIPQSSPVLSQVPPASTKPSVPLPSSSLKPPLPFIEPPSPVKNSQPKNVSQPPLLPPNPPPASLKPSTAINEPPAPQYKEEINCTHQSQIPFPDVNISDQLSTSFTFNPESPQTTLRRYSNIPEPEYDYQEKAPVTPNNSFIPPTSSEVTTLHRYENVPDSEQEPIHDTVDISLPDYSPPLPPKDFLPNQSTSEDIKEKLTALTLKKQDTVSAKIATSQPAETQYPHPTPPFLAINSQHDNITGTTPLSSSLRKNSIPVITRPSTAPPPPPPTSIPTQTTEQPKPDPQVSPSLPISSPNSPPPPPPILTENYIPSPPPPPPEYILQETAPASLQTLHRRTSSISSIASIPGSPLSPVGTASKSHLLEQIRQFKESGKGLKKANENVQCI